MSTMTAVSVAACLLSFGAISVLAALMWRRATLDRTALRQNIEDAALADWTRHMAVTVVTHTGSIWSMTLPELHASEHGDFRSWEKPLSVSIWSDRWSGPVPDTAITEER